MCIMCMYIYICTEISINTVKPLYPTTSTDRSLPYIDRFISIPNDHRYIYFNSLNRPPL